MSLKGICILLCVLSCFSCKGPKTVSTEIYYPFKADSYDTSIYMQDTAWVSGDIYCYNKYRHACDGVPEVYYLLVPPHHNDSLGFFEALATGALVLHSSYYSFYAPTDEIRIQREKCSSKVLNELYEAYSNKKNFTNNPLFTPSCIIRNVRYKAIRYMALPETLHEGVIMYVNEVRCSGYWRFFAPICD